MNRKIEQYARQFRLENLRNETEAEGRCKHYLELLSIPFEQQKIFYKAYSFYLADFFLEHLNLIIELDGHHHKSFKTQLKKDTKRDNFFLKKNISTLRITNTEMKGMDKWELAEKINVYKL